VTDGDDGGETTAARHLLRSAVGTVVPSRDDGDGPLPPVLLLLTFMTGVLDAVSFLGLGSVFVAVMTGNVVFLGFAIAGAPELSAAASALALVAFAVGAGVSGRLVTASGAHRGRLLLGGTILESLLIAAALVLSVAASGPAEQYSLIFLLASAMGIQNTVVRRLAVTDIQTTVLTLTLAGLVADPASGRSAQTGRRIVVVVATFSGALLGAWLTLHIGLPQALAVCLGLAVVATVAAVFLSRSHGDWTTTESR
jgi:uncharacterized membrane protein YoaK (UPF0700 family)